MRPKSDYTYKINEELNRVEIIDLCLGNMSVTNNAENVITDIRKEVGDKLLEMKIIYKDSFDEGFDTIEPIWDGIECVNVKFKFGI